MTRLLVKFGVKKTTLVAWVCAGHLFLDYFGIDSARAPSNRAKYILKKQITFPLEGATSKGSVYFLCSVVRQYGKDHVLQT